MKKVLYVTHNFEYVQPQIINHLNESNGAICDCLLVSHRIKAKPASYPDNYLYSEYHSNVKGPLFLVKKYKWIANDCLSLVRENGYSLLHANMSFSDGIVCRNLCSEIHIPYVLSVRDPDINDKFVWSVPSYKSEMIKNLINSKAIIFLSKPHMEALFSRTGSAVANEIKTKSYIVPNGIDDYYLENRFFKNEKSHEKIKKILFVGRIDRRKNLESLVRALEYLIERGQLFQLNVVGDMVDPFYESLIRKYNWIKHFKKCEKEKLIHYYREADVMCVPSHFETFGLVYAEAMSQGTPVLYTRNQGFDKQFEDGYVGYSVDDGNPIDIAKKLMMIFDHYLDMSHNCSESCLQFDWHNIVNRFLTIYNNDI